MHHAVHQRIEAGVIGGLAGREGHRAHGAPVEGAGEADEVGAPRVIARQLDGRLDGLGAGIGQERHRGLVERRHLVQLLGQFDHLGVVEVRGDVDELRGLLLDGLDHLGMRVPGGCDGDARHEIQKAIAVHVPDLGAFAVVDDERISARVGGRDHGRIALEIRAGLRPGQFHGFHTDSFSDVH